MTGTDVFAHLTLTNFRAAVDDGIATITFDKAGDKVNTLAAAVQREMEAIIDVVDREEAIVAAIFMSGKKDNFIAGADIGELAHITTDAEARELSTRAQKCFARLEEVGKRKPIVAAIHGAALGGGLELALACTHRVISDAEVTQLGLPEVKLGIIPGAGGTQRLPALIGIAEALDLILTGKQVRGKKALRLGLVDEVVPKPVLLDAARRQIQKTLRSSGSSSKKVSFAKRLRELADPSTFQQVALEDNPLGQRVLFKKARERLLEQTHGHYPAPEAALEAVRIGVLEGHEAGYAAEAERFGKLVVSAEAQALTALFFAQQELKKDPGAKADALPVVKVGVLGGGLMGAGIAYVTAAKLPAHVRLNEIDDKGIGRALKHVRGLFEKDVERKRTPRFEAERALARVTGTWDYSGFANADIVIEAVFEDLDLKHRVLRAVEERTGPKCVYASNTSSLPIAKIAAASKRPETVLGMHYFSPVEKMPLLEIIVTDKTADWATATAVKLGKSQGKTVIVVHDGPGFYTSRILAPYLNEAAWLLTEGASIEDIDDAMVDYGFPVGPITLLDEVGIDVGAKVAHVMFDAFGARMQAPDAVETLLRDGRQGRKNGRGFYLYAAGKRGGVDDSVYGLLGAASRRKRVAREEIIERMSLQMMNEAVRCLDEGILRSARDGDVGAVFGLGFPPFMGGPFRAIDKAGPKAILSRLTHYAAACGERFEPAKGLISRAESGKPFHG